MPLKCAGLRTEPPMSLPISSGDRRAAMATPPPPVEPPAVRPASQAFFVVPNKGLSV